MIRVAVNPGEWHVWNNGNTVYMHWVSEGFEPIQFRMEPKVYQELLEALELVEIANVPKPPELEEPEEG